MILTILSIILLALAIASYSCSQLVQHGKLKGQKDDDSFFGERSYYRKYANPLDAPKDNWYYRTFKIGYRERFLGSATIFVFLTDSYHLFQFFFFIFISLSVAFALGLTWWWFGVWILLHAIHAVVYKFFSR